MHVPRKLTTDQVRFRRLGRSAVENGPGDKAGFRACRRGTLAIDPPRGKVRMPQIRPSRHPSGSALSHWRAASQRGGASVPRQKMYPALKLSGGRARSRRRSRERQEMTGSSWQSRVGLGGIGVCGGGCGVCWATASEAASTTAPGARIVAASKAAEIRRSMVPPMRRKTCEDIGVSAGGNRPALTPPQN